MMMVNTKISAESWDNIDSELSKSYLHYYSKTMKYELGKFLTQLNEPKVLDVGCGNAQIYPILKTFNKDLIYIGLDISKNLLDVAKKVISNDDKLIESDIYEFVSKNNERFNVSILCHMIECTESPDFLIDKIKSFSDYIAILWYDYPKYDHDITFINNNPHSGDEFKPYIRRKISRDYWNFLISKNKLELVLRSNSDENDVLEIYKKMN